MELVEKILFYAFMGVFSQNLIFCGGIGIDTVIRQSDHPKRTLLMGILVAGFSMLTLVDRLLIDAMAGIFPWIKEYEFPLIILLQAVFCVLILLLLQKVKKRGILLALRSLVPTAAFSNLVILVGVLSDFLLFSPIAVFAFSIGTGAAFILASWIVREAVQRIGNPDMNRAFLGLPSLLIYIGILAMAFLGFTGTQILLV